MARRMGRQSSAKTWLTDTTQSNVGSAGTSAVLIQDPTDAVVPGSIRMVRLIGSLSLATNAVSTGSFGGFFTLGVQYVHNLFPGTGANAVNPFNSSAAEAGWLYWGIWRIPALLAGQTAFLNLDGDNYMVDWQVKRVRLVKDHVYRLAACVTGLSAGTIDWQLRSRTLYEST